MVSVLSQSLQNHLHFDSNGSQRKRGVTRSDSCEAAHEIVARLILRGVRDKPMDSLLQRAATGPTRLRNDGCCTATSIISQQDVMNWLSASRSATDHAEGSVHSTSLGSRPRNPSHRESPRRFACRSRLDICQIHF